MYVYGKDLMIAIAIILVMYKVSSNQGYGNDSSSYCRLWPWLRTRKRLWWYTVMGVAYRVSVYERPFG